MLLSVCRSWELELETSPAPLQLHPELLRSYNFFFNRGKSWIELAKWSAPVARTLSTSAHKVGICFHSVQSLFDLSRVVFLKVFIQSSISTYWPDGELLDIFFCESKSEW